MTHTIRRWGKIVWLVARGCVAGYMVYVPVLAVIERLTFGRIDEEHFFYGLFAPLLAPYLLAPAFWKSVRGNGHDELALILAGIVLLGVGATLSLWLGYKRRPPNDAITELSL